MKNSSKLFLVFILLAGTINTGRAQNSLAQDKIMKVSEVDSLIKSKNYVFEATRINGDSVNYHKYSVAIAKDTLVACLPGKSAADTAKISSTSFTYHLLKNEIGDKDVYITPNSGMSDVRQLFLQITPSGKASLRVVLTDASPFTLTGYIKQESY